MRNILILITLISGLIFTSLVKNKTRLLEKELVYLDNEINSLNFKLNEASLDFEYLTTPKRISLLANNFLEENFSYYKESQIKKSINDNTFAQLSTEKSFNKKSNIAKKDNERQLLLTKSIETQFTEEAFTGEETIKYLAILKKLKNNNIASQLSTEESINKKSNVARKTDYRRLQESKEISVSKKVHNWAGLQIIKSFFGIPVIPVK